MKKLLLLALAGAGLSLQASAQQRPQYSQYMMNNYLLNPAVTGVEDFLDFKAGMRRQWVGLEGAPITYYASAHAAIGKTGTIHTPFSLSQPKGGKRAPSPWRRTSACRWACRQAGGSSRSMPMSSIRSTPTTRPC